MMERDGQRFRFVLDYLRDGKVTLPTTETKEKFVSELEYYNIGVDMDTISKKFDVWDLMLAKQHILKCLEETVKLLEEGAMQYLCAKIAFFCCRGCLREDRTNGMWQIVAGNTEGGYTENGGEEFYSSVMALREVTDDSRVLIDNVNHFLNDTGLELIATNAVSICPCSRFYYFFIKVSDQN